MNHLTTKEHCNGCHACYNACPVHAISMQRDEEGFLYPVINPELCIGCGKCDKACPILDIPKQNSLDETYACYAKDSTEHQSSSSGGAFAVFAREILNHGGIVCGAAFDSNQGVFHILIDKISDLSQIKGTKYVQSTIGDAYQCVKENLETGREVLFSGTPCQVAGLKSFLSKEYENLLTIDLICHGVPSPEIWEKYLQEIASGEKLAKVTFRNKTMGISHVTLDYLTKSGRLIQENYSDSLYIKGFLQNLYVRPSCCCCPFKGEKRCSDITIGDYWSAKEYHKEMVNDYGVSVIIIHSNCGRQLLDQCRPNFVLEASTSSHAAVWNESMLQPAMPSPNRDHFFNEVQTTSVCRAIEANLITPPPALQKNIFKKIETKLKGRLRRWLV